MRFLGRAGTQDPVTGRWTTENGLVTVNSSDPASDDGRHFTAANHNGNANFVFGDGSVHAIRASVDIETLHRLSSIYDGQPITTNYGN